VGVVGEVSDLVEDQELGSGIVLESTVEDACGILAFEVE